MGDRGVSSIQISSRGVVISQRWYTLSSPNQPYKAGFERKIDGRGRRGLAQIGTAVS